MGHTAGFPVTSVFVGFKRHFGTIRARIGGPILPPGTCECAQTQGFPSQLSIFFISLVKSPFNTGNSGLKKQPELSNFPNTFKPIKHIL